MYINITKIVLLLFQYDLSLLFFHWKIRLFWNLQRLGRISWKANRWCTREYADQTRDWWQGNRTNDIQCCVEFLAVHSENSQTSTEKNGNVANSLLDNNNDVAMSQVLPPGGNAKVEEQRQKQSRMQQRRRSIKTSPFERACV